jgi:hypothetical protein
MPPARLDHGRLITPLAFYPGFPAAITASALAHATLHAAAEN